MIEELMEKSKYKYLITTIDKEIFVFPYEVSAIMQIIEDQLDLMSSEDSFEIKIIEMTDEDYEKLSDNSE